MIRHLSMACPECHKHEVRFEPGYMSTRDDPGIGAEVWCNATGCDWEVHPDEVREVMEMDRPEHGEPHEQDHSRFMGDRYES